MFHVLRLVAPLVHDEGEDTEGDGVHRECTDHRRTDPSEKKAVSLLFQAELQRKEIRERLLADLRRLPEDNARVPCTSESHQSCPLEVAT